MAKTVKLLPRIVSAVLFFEPLHNKEIEGGRRVGQEVGAEKGRIPRLLKAKRRAEAAPPSRKRSETSTCFNQLLLKTEKLASEPEMDDSEANVDVEMPFANLFVHS
ncbi:hypothetical protein M9H77_23210 [Catharanthus roseus]|uniref:Uncharacterized protein n=1 Tax=Catharanthus roseus TaxID=4058 RepID=A0ACC0AV70_CATRO|nr:hypothetical protein M9H77_23210 [Catharanthus roseus]